MEELKAEAAGSSKKLVTCYQLHSVKSQRSTIIIFVENYFHLVGNATQSVAYLCFKEAYCLHIQGKKVRKREAAISSKTLVNS
jgi:hypothetical protein